MNNNHVHLDGKVVLSLLSKQHMMRVPSVFYSPVTVEKH